MCHLQQLLHYSNVCSYSFLYWRHFSDGNMDSTLLRRPRRYSPAEEVRGQGAMCSPASQVKQPVQSLDLLLVKSTYLRNVAFETPAWNSCVSSAKSCKGAMIVRGNGLTLPICGGGRRLKLRFHLGEAIP